MYRNHVAIILDGNGRWAKAKGMPRRLRACQRLRQSGTASADDA